MPAKAGEIDLSAALLKQAIDVAIVRDTQPVPLAERDDFRRLG